MSYPISENIAKLVERLSDNKDSAHKSLYISELPRPKGRGFEDSMPSCLF